MNKFLKLLLFHSIKYDFLQFLLFRLRYPIHLSVLPIDKLSTRNLVGNNCILMLPSTLISIKKDYHFTDNLCFVAYATVFLI